MALSLQADPPDSTQLSHEFFVEQSLTADAFLLKTKELSCTTWLVFQANNFLAINGGSPGGMTCRCGGKFNFPTMQY